MISGELFFSDVYPGPHVGTTWPAAVLTPPPVSGVGRRESLSVSLPWRGMRMRSRPLPG